VARPCRVAFYADLTAADGSYKFLVGGAWRVSGRASHRSSTNLTVWTVGAACPHNKVPRRYNQSGTSGQVRVKDAAATEYGYTGTR
jgi:hypothetical protein